MHRFLKQRRRDSPKQKGSYHRRPKPTVVHLSGAIILGEQGPHFGIKTYWPVGLWVGDALGAFPGYIPSLKSSFGLCDFPMIVSPWMLSMGRMLQLTWSFVEFLFGTLSFPPFTHLINCWLFCVKQYSSWLSLHPQMGGHISQDIYCN